MNESWFNLISRRQALVAGLAGAAGVSGVRPASAKKPSVQGLGDLSDPKTNLALFRKINASAKDGEEVTIYYSGINFGSPDGGLTMVPLFGMEGLARLKTFALPNGGVRHLACETAVHTDLATGKVLDTWINPFTDRKVDVWHLRNGPLNYDIAFDKSMAAGGWRFLRPNPVAESAFHVPIQISGDDVIIASDAQANRKNPLQPDEWPLESTGERLIYSEHNTLRATLKEMADPMIPTPAMFASWHSLVRWRPFMLMGQAPGGIYNHLVARKIKDLALVPEPVRAYNEKHFAKFMSAPDAWTGTYVTNWDHYKAERQPIKA